MTDSPAHAARDQWLDGAGGRLFIRHWPAFGTAVASLVICHGFNAHGGHYARAAEVFAQRGFAVTALDLRGRGRSEGERSYVDTFDDYVDDLSQAIEFARAQMPDVPLHLLGHSAGGVVAATYALDHQDGLAGLICESFAHRVFAPDFALQMIKGASYVVPHAQMLRLKRQDFSRDPAWQAVLERDPFIHDEMQPVKTMAALTRANERLDHAAGKLTLPILILHGTADKAADPRGSRMFFDAVGSPDKTLRLYDGHYHDLLNDLDRDRVTNDIGNWLTKRSAGTA